MRLQLSWEFVKLQLDSRIISGILSSSARLARCILCPSSLPPRRLRGSIIRNDPAQYVFPFLGEATFSSPGEVVDHPGQAEGEHGGCSSAKRSRHKAPLLPVQDMEKASATNRNSPKKTAKRKPPATVDVPGDSKLLVSRKAAAVIVSLSLRKIDGLLASKQLPFRKIGTRTLIPIAALQRFARMDHPERIAS